MSPDLISISRFMMLSFVLGGLAPSTALGLVDDAIPTKLVLPTGPAGYPDPICSQCRARTFKSTSSGSSEDSAVVSLTFESDDGMGFWGDVDVMVRLYDGERRVVYSAPVSLADAETFECDVPSGSDWSWDDVEVVWVELGESPT